ncbi:MAG TPA: substrate-binding domain-containing protein [Gemmatimonadales bacterium]|nr:substrate-binding domain-containing protein [Gemmatimonadales bacterium]
MIGRLRSGVALLFLGLLPGPRSAQQTTASRDLILATTTSIRDAGLLDALLPLFERREGRRVKVLAVGSGQAMEIGRRGEADLLIVHDPEREHAFVAAGLAVERIPLMHNAFVIVGPKGDPARVRGNAVAEALRRIAARHARFISRGDRSGTHSKEAALWSAAGVAPRGAWYLEAGQGMGQTLQIASELQAYALTDVGTFLAHKSPLDLEILVEGDTALSNPYHVLLLNPAKFAWLDHAGARRLRDFLLDGEIQRQIGEFGRRAFGRSLFTPAGSVDRHQGR